MTTKKEIEMSNECELILNIYGQESWHTEAKIVGSPPALQALKDALERAIHYGYAEVSEKSTDDVLFASDGEGYELEIIRLGGWDDKRWQLYIPEYSITKDSPK